MKLYPYKACMVFFVAVFALNLLSGCVTADKKQTSIQTEAQASQPGSREMLFMDSNVFDFDLSSNLKQKPKEVAVNTHDISINAIPDRLDKWFFFAKSKYGAKVQMHKVSDTRAFSLMSLSGIAVNVGKYIFNKVKEYTIYSAVKNYDIHIFYYAKTGKIQKVRFLHKKKQ